MTPRWKPDPFGHTLQEGWADLENLTIWKKTNYLADKITPSQLPVIRLTNP